MENEQYLDLMFERYKLWLDKSKPLTKEEAAFEYLKRNPYFIETILFHENHLRAYPNYKSDDKQMFEVMRIKHHMYALLSKIFLYTGSDIANKYRVYEEDKTNDMNLANFLSFDKSNLEDEGYPYDYSGIYYPQPSMQSENKSYKTSNSVKKQYPVDSGALLKDIEQERWLSHLLPSLFLNINPFYSSDRLKSDLAKLLSIISNDEAVETEEVDGDWKRYYQYAIPEILINEDATEFESFAAPKFTSDISTVSLMMYDLRYMFHFKAPELENLLLEKFSTHEYAKYKIDKYFDSSGASDCYSSIVYAKEFNKTRTREVRKRINGGYLDFIYPKESIIAHFRLVQKEGLKEFEKHFEDVPEEEPSITKDKFWEALKTHHKSREHIADIYAMGIVNVRDFTADEYREWSADIHNLLKETKTSKNIFSILLL
ncbi:MAG: hypothetical protein U9R50_00105 [Campylobacterota bacterium]|nr:hypothetical protein [Campylobacterota bacterium]